MLGPLLEVATSKKCTPLWREAHFQVKMYKAHHCQTTFGSCDVEKVHAVVARSTFRSQNVQNTPASDILGSGDVEKVRAVVARSTFRSQNVRNTPRSDHFWTFRARFAWQAQGIVRLVKSEQNSKTWGLCRISKNDGRRGAFEEDLQRCIFRGRRSTKDMFMRDVRMSGR